MSLRQSEILTGIKECIFPKKKKSKTVIHKRKQTEMIKYKPLCFVIILTMSGCAAHNEKNNNNALEFVDNLLSDNSARVTRIQQNFLQLNSGTEISGRHIINPVSDKFTLAPGLNALLYNGTHKPQPALTPAGKADTLSKAVSGIVPAGWSVHFAPEINKKKREILMWPGNEQWPHVLNKLMQDQGFLAFIDWNRLSIEIKPNSGVK